MNKCKNCPPIKVGVKDKVKQILSGYKNLVNKSDKVEELSQDRLRLCLSCENIKVLGFMGVDVLAICNICKCPIQAKIRSIDGNNKCPINKW